jgi:hypothetical protein
MGTGPRDEVAVAVAKGQRANGSTINAMLIGGACQGDHEIPRMESLCCCGTPYSTVPVQYQSLVHRTRCLYPVISCHVLYYTGSIHGPNHVDITLAFLLALYVQTEYATYEGIKGQKHNVEGRHVMKCRLIIQLGLAGGQ